jgi:hypothetical protein
MAPAARKKRAAAGESAVNPDPPKRTRGRGPARKAQQPATAEPSPTPTVQLTPVTFTDFPVIPDMSAKALLEFLPKPLLNIVQAAEVPSVENTCLSS